MIEWLLGVIAAELAGLGWIAYRSVRWSRSSAAQLAVVAKAAAASARVTSTTTTDRSAVHLVLMDRQEQHVDFVMVIDPAQRAQTMTHGTRQYACVSGSVDDGYFVYRRA